MRVMRLISVCVLAGCASSGSAPSLGVGGERSVRIEDSGGVVSQVSLRADDLVRSMELPVDYATAWERLPHLLVEMGLTIGGIDETRGRVSQREARVRRIDGKRMSTYLECGRGVTAQPHADNYAVSLSYEVALEPNDAIDGITAHVRVEATATPRDVRGSTLRCTSKGTLEGLVFNRLLAQVVGEV